MQMASLGGGSKRIKDAQVPDGRLVGSYLCAWHRSWTDYGHSECMVRRSAASAKWGCHRLIFANVYGLVGVNHSWPRWNALCPFPRCYLSLERLFPSPSFESAEFNRCAISLPQQTGQETIISTYSLSCSYIGQQVRPTWFILREHRPRHARRLIHVSS